MKNLFTTLFLLLTVLTVNAQNEDYKMTAGIHAGYSLTGALAKLITDSDPTSTVNATATPAMQLTFDYGLSKLFSLGVAFSYQRIGFDATDFTYVDQDFNTRTETFKTSYTRTQIAIRPLIHYGNSDKLDMYSGFRIGILGRSFSDFESENGEELDETVFNGSFGLGSRFSGCITAFGIRYYFTDNIGAGLEINTGAPYIVNAGVSARF